jgi:hypothetical protein
MPDVAMFKVPRIGKNAAMENTIARLSRRSTRGVSESTDSFFVGAAALGKSGLERWYAEAVDATNESARNAGIYQNILVVPVEGIEPPLLAEHDFESCASTSSATRAYAFLYIRVLAASMINAFARRVSR